MATTWRDADDEVQRLGKDASDEAWCFASRAARLGLDWPNIAIQAVLLEDWQRWTELSRTEANHLMALAGRRWERWQAEREAVVM